MKRLAAAVALLLTASALPAPSLAGDKLALLAEKQRAAAATPAERQEIDRRLRKQLGKPPPPVVNVWNTWTHETLVLDDRIDQATLSTFLRCHFTDQPAPMDMRLLGVLGAAARRFAAPRIEIVSGYRAPKYNLMLRKKGHEVARDSQHTYGHAVDFRLRGVPTRKLLQFVRSLHLGGAGFYPESAFVHADTGPVRFWAGQ